ncbi:alpha/beta hydrolase [Aquisalimonas sp. 2447]|uniref:alpha/beta fold hydrolase n=1 Tax=Aquisalimonas sp. 2447 TaxID=2740807 RepID=UPI0014327CF0|nr:alpha/beta hydrolase [Aquisalimonas sp. 2447]QIT56103.1 alpha/beta hydrolase [Aquisalimonas sp. 2447]
MSREQTSSPEEHRYSVNGVTLSCFEWPADRDHASEPPVLLVHATGFHARCWDQVVSRLDGRRVLAVDMRGHGRSAKQAPLTWDVFGEDLAQLVRLLGLDGAVGVGHSMGAHSLVQAAAANRGAFRRLLLLDPVIFPPDRYVPDQLPGDYRDHPTARRRNQWSSWEAMYERFTNRAPFCHWENAVLEDYCRWGLVPAEDGDGYVLACPPWVEASVYVNSLGADIHAQVAGLPVPVTVVRAKAPPAQRESMDFSSSPTWPDLAASFPNGRDLHLPGHSHFIPMEDPDLVADLIVDDQGV